MVTCHQKQVNKVIRTDLEVVVQRLGEATTTSEPLRVVGFVCYGGRASCTCGKT